MLKLCDIYFGDIDFGDIYFDELYNYTGWEVGEYKALREVFKENEYKFLAFSREGAQVVIQIL